VSSVEAVEALDLHDVCRARIIVSLLLPKDDQVSPPCDPCRQAAAAALQARQSEGL
jgi:hypothetical protein